MDSASPAAKAPRRKLTEADVLEILRSTETQRAIAARFGIQQPHVSDIKSGRRWTRIQPDKAYQPRRQLKRRPSKTDIVSDAQIEKYDPMIKMMINDHVLKYWAGGNTCATLDPRATIGRLGMSVEDLIQQGRMFVFAQTRWLQKHLRKGKGAAKDTTLMFLHLRRKFISLSRSFATARGGGQVVAVEENRQAVQELINRTSASEIPVQESLRALQDALPSMGKDLQKALSARVLDEAGGLRVESTEEINEILRARLAEMTCAQHVNLDDVGESATDQMNPEIYYLAMEQITMNSNEKDFLPVTSSEPSPRRRGRKASKFRIFQVAKEKGLPSTHGALAKYLEYSAPALSNILHGHSPGSAAFRQKIQALFGESIDELRKPATDEKTTVVKVA